MKQVKITAFCDGADHEDRIEAGHERMVQIDGGEPVVLDLCDVCDKIFVDLLALMERGSPPDPPRRTDRPSRRRSTSGMATTCPECGRSSATRSALGQHTRMQHGKGLRDYPGLSKTGLPSEG